MKARGGFILRNLAGEYVLTPVGEQMKSFDGVAVMNELSAFIWERLQRDVSRQELLSAILEEYDVEEETCGRDLDTVLKNMLEMGVIEE